MTLSVGNDCGSLVSGFAKQTGKNLILEPWWGANTASSKPRTRIGEIGANASFILGGGALAAIGVHQLMHYAHEMPGGLMMRMKGAFTHGLSGPMLAWGAATGVGLIAIATGIRALTAHTATGGGTTPVDPKPPKPPVDPEPPVDPKPPKPPVDPEPPVDPKPPKPPVDPEPPVDPKPPVSVPLEHVVKRGEYLTFIANCFNVTMDQLYMFNRDTIGDSPDLIKIGQVLKIPPHDYVPGSYTYKQLFEPGHATPGLVCDPISPKAQQAECPAG